MATRNEVSIVFKADGSDFDKKLASAKRGAESFGQSVREADSRGLAQLERGFEQAGARARTFGAQLEGASTKTSGLRSVLAGFAGGALATGVLSFFKEAGRAAIEFGQASLEAAQRAADAQRFLQTSAKLTGQDLGGLVGIAERVREAFGVSRAEAEALVARAAQFTSAAGRPQDTEKFLRAIGDSAVAAGRSLKELPEILQQLSGGGLEAALDKVLGGKNPSQIFAERFKEVGAKNAEALTDAQQKIAVLNEILERSKAVSGSAADRFGDFGAKTEVLAARFEDLQASIGKVIARSEGLNRLVDQLTKFTEKANDPQAAKSIERIGEAFGGLLQASVIGLGAIGTTLALVKTGIDAISTGIVGLAKLFDVVARETVANLRIAIGEALSIVPAAFRPALGINFDPAELAKKAKQDFQIANEELVNFSKSQFSVLQQDAQRVLDLIKLTRDAAKQAGEFGKFKPETGTASPGAGFNASTTPPPIIPNSGSAFFGAQAGIGQQGPTVVKPVLIFNGDSLESVDVLTRAQIKATAEQTGTIAGQGKGGVALGDRIGLLTDELKSLRDENKKLRDAIEKGALIEVTAGPGTQVDSVVPRGNFGRP